MATNFPTSIDTYSNVADGNTIQIATTNNMQDAIEALEAKVGIDSSAVTSSHDYKIGAIETILGSASTADLTKLHGVTATADELNIMDGVTANKDELNKLDADSSYNCSFRAYVNADQNNVTGDGTAYEIKGSFFTESFDDGANFSNGTFTAPVTSNKYHFGITLNIAGITSSHNFMWVALVTTSKLYVVCQIDPWNACYQESGGAATIPIHIDNIPMSASDTAYWLVNVLTGSKVVDVLDNYTEVWGGLSL